MKNLIYFCLVAAFTPGLAIANEGLPAQADYFQSLYANPPNTTTIAKKTKMNVGETRPKAVLKGVFYFGGSDGKRTPLSSSYQKLLCQEGFSSAYSVYSKPSGGTDCNGNSLGYHHIGEAKEESDGGSQVAALMREIYNVIKSNGEIGPIYVHCFYGVHASSTIAQMVLKQFCDIDNSTALSNWKAVNLYNSLGADGVEKQKRKITAFRPNPNLRLTPEEQATVCY